MNSFHGKISLEIPNSIQVLPVMIDVARSISMLLGFPDEDIRRIELSVEEAIGNIIKFAFEEGEEEVIRVDFSLETLGLGVSILEKGMPFDPDLIAEFSPEKFKQDLSEEGLGMYLMKQFMDEFSFINHGKSGKETRLFKYLPHKSVEDLLDRQELENVRKERDDDVLPKDSVKYSVRLLKPEEAVEVSKCAFASYGYTYVHEAIYYPDRVREMNANGDLISFVAVNDDNGEIMAHFALEKEEDAMVPQVGVASTKPKYRGQGAMGRLNVVLLEEAKKRNFLGVFGKGITTHPFSQKTMLKFELYPCAFLLSSGKERQYKGIEQKIIQRESVVLHFQYLNQEVGLALYLPKNHADMIRRIYGFIGGSPMFKEPPLKMDALLDETVLKLRTNTSSLTADIFIKDYGKDFVKQIAANLTALCREKTETIYLHLRLADSHTALLCEQIEELGFFFAGILPGSAQGDVLILQYLNNHVIDYEYVSIACDESMEIMNYVRKHDPSQRR